MNRATIEFILKVSIKIKFYLNNSDFSSLLICKSLTTLKQIKIKNNCKSKIIIPRQELKIKTLLLKLKNLIETKVNNKKSGVN